MSIEILRSVWLNLTNEGLFTTFRLCLSRVTDLSFDLRYKTETYKWVAPSNFGLGPELIDGVEYYKPTNAVALRTLLTQLGLRGKGILLDVGCGKGRVMMVAAELGFDVARGVEFSPVLGKVCEENLAIYRIACRPLTQFEVAIKDVRSYQFRDDETVVYLFNPFGRNVTEHVVEKIEASLHRKSRLLHFIYRAPEHREVVDASRCFCRAECHLISGQRFHVYRSIFKSPDQMY